MWSRGALRQEWTYPAPCSGKHTPPTLLNAPFSPESPPAWASAPTIQSFSPFSNWAIRPGLKG